MGRIDEIISGQFAAWEKRGRGWQVWPYPVSPEPPFRPFTGFHLPPPDPDADDGRKPSFLSSLIQSLESKLAPKPPRIREEPEAEPEPEPLERKPLVELQTSLPADFDVGGEVFKQLLYNLGSCHEPVAFELLAVPGRVNVQFATSQADAPAVRRQLQAYFPKAIFLPREGTLEQAWEAGEGDEALVVEFGLAHEFMFLLASVKEDFLVGLIGALMELRPGDLGLFQVIFQSARRQWGESILNSVHHSDGKPLFVNRTELSSSAEQKVSSPLFAAVVRIATKGTTFERALEIARDMAGSLGAFMNPQGNELIPLANDDYPFNEHIEDMLARQSRRCGMLLNRDELSGLVHLPSSDVRSPVFERLTAKTKAAPEIVRSDAGLLLGNNEHAGETVTVRLSAEQRTRHCHIVGASGTGKSTLLFNLIRQDIENGEGVAVLDPHGDLIDRILGIIPKKRIDEVVLVDPSDVEYSVGFNILSAHSELEKNLLASDLVAVFQRLSTSWGDQMNSVLQNAILAFLESDRRGTIADLRRFLIEPAFRNEFLKSVKDSEVIYYWQKSFPHLSGGKSIGSILTRLDALLAQKPIRHMVSQPENRLDFAHIMDSGKIFLAKLPEGLLGRENSYLLGALLVAKFQQIAMSRQARAIASRRDFWLYIDEFANFITPSMAEILTNARKYRIGLTLAHHELQQLERNPDVASAVMSHPFTRIVFRVGDTDARKLADGFSYFEAKDLRNLETGQAVCRVERSDFDFNLSVPLSVEPNKDEATLRRQEIITVSGKKYGTARADVEAMLAKSKLSPPTAPPPTSLPVPTATFAPQPQPQRAAEVPPPSPPIVIPPTAEVPKTKEEPIASALKDLGRGGALHKSIQERLQAEARTLGFFSEREKTLNAMNEAADVVVQRSDFTLAVEIALTTTTDHEFGNVKKCLSAGFTRVAVVSPSPERLERIETAVQAGLGPEGAAKVSYYTPDDFIVELRKLAAESTPKPESSPPGERVTRGFKVRRHGPALTPDERKSKEQIAHQILSDVMKQKP